MTILSGFSRIAALLADPAREAIVVALADGRAMPAGELAEIGGITPQSASGHLRKLVEGGVISVWRQGRFRYFRLANEDIAAAVEALARAAQPGERRGGRTGPAHLVEARCCYSHLAGRLGVALADGLADRGYVRVADDAVSLTPDGASWAAANEFIPRSGSGELRLCLDGTERRFHFAGGLATAILHRLLGSGRMKRQPDRGLSLTPAGKAWFADLGITG
jgi:DNA-binding transcriptional ArsR family regulator